MLWFYDILCHMAATYVCHFVQIADWHVLLEQTFHSHVMLDELLNVAAQR